MHCLTRTTVHMNYSPKLLKGASYRGLYRGTTIGAIKGDTRRLDYGSNEHQG